MFNRLLGYLGGYISGTMANYASRRQRDLYTQAQLEILQTQEARFHNEVFEDVSLSMSSWQSSSSSESNSGEEEVVATVEANALGMPYFASLEKRMKEKGLKEEEKEFFKKEDFDI